MTIENKGMNKDKVKVKRVKRSKEEIKADMGDGYKKLTTIQEALRNMDVKFATRDNIIAFLVDNVKTAYTAPAYQDETGELIPETFRFKELLYHIQDFIDIKEKRVRTVEEIEELDI